MRIYLTEEIHAILRKNLVHNNLFYHNYFYACDLHDFKHPKRKILKSTPNLFSYCNVWWKILQIPKLLQILLATMLSLSGHSGRDYRPGKSLPILHVDLIIGLL